MPPMRSDVSQAIPVAGRRAWMVLPNTTRRGNRRTRANSEDAPPRTQARGPRNRTSLLAPDIAQQTSRGRVTNITPKHRDHNKSRRQRQSSREDQSYHRAYDTPARESERQSSRAMQSPSQRHHVFIKFENDSDCDAGRNLSPELHSTPSRGRQSVRFEEAPELESSRQLTGATQSPSHRDRTCTSPDYNLYRGVDSHSNRVRRSTSERALSPYFQNLCLKPSTMRNEHQIVLHESNYEHRVVDNQDVEYSEAVDVFNYNGLTRLSEFEEHVLMMMPQDVPIGRSESLHIGFSNVRIPWKELVGDVENKYQIHAAKLLLVDENSLNQLFKGINRLRKEKADLEDENAQLADAYEFLRESAGAGRSLLPKGTLNH